MANEETNPTPEQQPESETPQVETAQENTANPSSDKLHAEAQEFKDKYLRLYAEFDNFRKRTAKERLETELQANRKLMNALLPVLDDFERAQSSIQKAEEKEKAALEALDILYKRLADTLKQNGLKPMDSAIGNTLDAELQEGIAIVPVAEEDKKGKIIDEIEKGYYLHDKVLRFAKVVIGS
ncbi:nucleotide exchange factor GrpE [Hugenholtzia roseola]|uniref:nucleotide exchange factor GrpE n=1 Tax=Hugenholtzia roseola TaxID=1002 RepID=UPI00047BAC00|nr:nucleotide exchange factor GrpE [Hugenholtzia roseola]